jgi:hypothetical protein
MRMMTPFGAATVAGWLLCSPAAIAQAPGESSAVPPGDCDHQCLIGLVHDYVAALGHKDPSLAHFARNVRFTENDVEMPFGHEGLWATVTSVASHGLEAADPATGQAAWLGTAEEHGEPVYLAVRLRVHRGAIVEVETVVTRKTGLPLPFGDAATLVHDQAFSQVLPPEQRRPRERLIAVADSYFNTVELNDGMVFAPFDPDCARTENGIVTTRAGAGSAGDIAPGCEAQLRLGLYRINERVRERRYPLVDEERGVVIATGFFDHANAFDRYRTTDGKERRTLLEWPNSITLIEAFRIRDGRIQRVEAIFTYVPYFMHSPWYPRSRQVAGNGERFASTGAADTPCDRDCLTGIAERFMQALADRNPRAIPWGTQVRYAENSVPMMVGDGLWATARKLEPSPLLVADPQAGAVVWYGVVDEHDAPAFAGVRLHVTAGCITEAQTTVSRKFNPGPFGDPAAFAAGAAHGTVLPESERASRGQLRTIAEGYLDTRQSNASLRFVGFDASCSERLNGAPLVASSGHRLAVADRAHAVPGCEGELTSGVMPPVGRVRDRRIVAIDEERGLVVATSFDDHPLHATAYTTADAKEHQTPVRYPSSRERLEILAIRKGRIARIESLSVFQPYRMPAAW